MKIQREDSCGTPVFSSLAKYYKVSRPHVSVNVFGCKGIRRRMYQLYEMKEQMTLFKGSERKSLCYICQKGITTMTAERIGIQVMQLVSIIQIQKFDSSSHYYKQSCHSTKAFIPSEEEEE